MDPNANLKIRTNNVPRDVLNFWELTGKEQAQLLDDYSGTGRAEEFCDKSMWARYKGHVYCLSEFLRIQHHPDSDFSKWEGYEGDNYFSGTVCRFVQKGERVIMGQYFS